MEHILYDNLRYLAALLYSQACLISPSLCFACPVGSVEDARKCVWFDCVDIERGRLQLHCLAHPANALADE